MSTALPIGVGHHHLWALPHGGRRSTDRTTHQLRRDLPALAARERTLTRLDLPGDGGAVIGTQRALYLSDGNLSDGNAEWHRIGWIDVARAGWSRATGSTVLQLWPVDGKPGIKVRVPSGAGFAAFADERVTATQLLCRHVQLTPTSAATITALREPGLDRVCWQVRLQSDADRKDPAITIAAERALADLRALAGC